MFNETMVTLVGYVATAPVYRETAFGGGAARFRMGVTPRRWDRAKEEWTDGHTSFYTVWAPRTLGVNVAASVSVGEPVLVQGRMKVRDGEHEGRRQSSVEIDAVAVGHDLARGTTDFRRGTSRAGAAAGTEAARDGGAGDRPPASLPEPGAEAILLPGPVPEPVPAPPF